VKAHELWFTSCTLSIQTRSIRQSKGAAKKGFEQIRPTDRRRIRSDVEYVEDGRRKSLSRKELAVKQHIQKGIRGDLPNIAALLDLRDEAKKSSRAKPKIVVENWMPDRPGQTGEQKTRETAAARARERNAIVRAESSNNIQSEKSFS
jgi:hypothetical protein